jgi:hypothetical protein
MSDEVTTVTSTTPNEEEWEAILKLPFKTDEEKRALERVRKNSGTISEGEWREITGDLCWDPHCFTRINATLRANNIPFALQLPRKLTGARYAETATITTPRPPRRRL